MVTSLSAAELDARSLTIQLSQVGSEKSELQSQLLVKDQELAAMTSGQQNEVRTSTTAANM